MINLSLTAPPPPSSKTAPPCSQSSLLLSTRQNIAILIDEIETISKELIVQTLNSNRIKPASDGSNELTDLTRLLIQKQEKLNQLLTIAQQQQETHKKIVKVKEALVEVDMDIKNLILYLKEAEQVLSSAVYQSRLKLDMISKAKKLPTDLIIRYAHKISSEYGVCCPENWQPDNPVRPYPTDADMRKGWLAKFNTAANDVIFNGNDTEIENVDDDENNFDVNNKADQNRHNQRNQQQFLMRSNSKVMIDPIVPQEFGFNNNKDKDNYKSGNNSTEYMSDSSSENDSNPN